VNAEEVVAALDLPPGARVDRRVPKTLLVEHGAPTAADKRRINEGIEEVQWLAALKPTTISVPVYRDEIREYLEIAVLNAVLRIGAKIDRLAELIHRAVPYPVLLIATEGERLTLSLAHKRWSQGEIGATVLDGDLVTAVIEAGRPDGFVAAFREALALAQQPRVDLYHLYQGWIDALIALLAARVTGVFNTAASPDQAAARRELLRECNRLDVEIVRLRAAAEKERQVPKQVELNLELKRLEAGRAAALAKL
jgi:hypothetical protein